MQIQVVVDMVAGDKRGRVSCQTLHTLLRSIIILTWEACSQPSSLLTSSIDSRFTCSSSLHVSGFSIHSLGWAGAREGTVENFPEGISDGEHDSQAHESQLLPHGKLKSVNQGVHCAGLMCVLLRRYYNVIAVLICSSIWFNYLLRLDIGVGNHKNYTC